ncbi:zincin-like metallopeptidase domain-containing protein [Chromobacterium piscinae]|uniref:zincin-like metallopeptidase domain-containing protein n=1 Tax=Chromobacterium piscinae TaxID=686831 RepID=UPI001E54C5C5|nr:zincin-like metallopeptidase domain-containing protein [Chromobacterium piscinae]MCD5327952.1 ssDNA-binding domain-containing protein [Chromobacterium piscinae]
MAVSNQRDYRAELTAQIIDLLQKNKAPWVKPWNGNAPAPTLPFNPVTAGGRSYRGINALWLQIKMMTEGWEDPRFVTFNQAVDSGWKVIDSKGTQLQFWELTEEQVQTNADGKLVKVKVPLKEPRSHIFTVFNAAQIEGMPALKLPERNWQPIEMAEAILARSKVSIIHDQADRAFYHMAADEIHLPPQTSFADATRYYAVALHELGHATGHPSRLNREFGDSFKSPTYAREELRAELASFFLSFNLGIPHEPGQHAAYTGSWIQALQEDQNEIFRAARDAEQICNHIMSMANEIQLEREQPKLQRQAVAPFTTTLQQRPEEIEVERISATGKTDRQGVYRSKVSFRLNGKPATLELAEAKGQPQPVSHYIQISADGKSAEGSLFHNGSVDLSEADDFTAIDSPARRQERRQFKQVAETVLQLRDGQKASISVEVSQAKNPVASAFKGVLAGLRQVRSLSELQTYCVSVDEGFLNRQLVMDDNDWVVFTQAVAAKTAQLDRGNTQTNRATAPAPAAPPSEKRSNEPAERELGRTFLAVPFDEIKRAKALGARWDKDQKVWYLPPGKDVGALKQWIVDNSTLIAAGINPADVLIAFENEMRSYGLVVRESPINDGKWHYVPTETSRGNAKNGGYVLNMAGIPSGYIKNFKNGVEGPWRYDGVQLTPEQMAALEAQSREQALLRDREVAAQQSQIADACEVAFNQLKSTGVHDYMDRKDVGAYGVRFASGKEVDIGKLLNLEHFRRSDEDWFIIPGQDVNGKIWTLQAISSNKNTPKLFVRDARKKGAFHLVGANNMSELSKAVAILFAEGYATGASLHEATGLPVVIGFDSGNLAEVAKSVCKVLPANQPKLFCADNDQFFVDKVIQRLGEVAGFDPTDPSKVKVATSLTATRDISLQGLKADGQWHEHTLGRYRLEMEIKTDVVVEVRAELQKRGNDGRYERSTRLSSHNTGLRAAADAAKLVGGMMTAPDFASLDGQPTDFNDLAVREGPARVRQTVGNSLGLGFARLSTQAPVAPQTMARRELARTR